MFQGCRSITNIPENLFRNVLLNENSLVQMFQGCTGITEIPVNLFTGLIIPKYCCANMFRYCLGITEIHNILNNIQKLREGCFSGMFMECKNIKKVTLSTSLDIPNDCFESMFMDCKNINKISYGCKKLGNDVSSNWVSGVQTTDGIWENLNGYNYTEYSDSAIPEKWYKGFDVDNYQPSYIGDLSDCFCIYNSSRQPGNKSIIDFTITINPDLGNTAYPYTLYMYIYRGVNENIRFTRITSKTVDISLHNLDKCYLMRRCSDKMNQISPISIKATNVDPVRFQVCRLTGNAASLYYGSDGINSAPRNIYIGDDSSGKYLGLYNHIGVTVYTDQLIN